MLDGLLRFAVHESNSGSSEGLVCDAVLSRERIRGLALAALAWAWWLVMEACVRKVREFCCCTSDVVLPFLAFFVVIIMMPAAAKGSPLGQSSCAAQLTQPDPSQQSYF